MFAIRLDNVSKRYPGHVATDGVSLDVAAGTFVVVLGPSGCGKTTLLRLIAGFERADAGRIALHGDDVTDRPPGAREIGMVFQSYALFPHLDVADNLTFGLQLRRVPRVERARRLAQTSRLLGLDQLLARRPAQLSGGQQQRVALGRAIIGGRRIILMDEPLSNLDARLRQDMRREIKALASDLGITVLYVTHDQAEALAMGDVVVVMHQGRIEQVAPPAMLYEQPASAFVARFIGTPPMNLIELATTAGGLCVAGTGQRLDLPGAAPGRLLGLRPERLRPVDQGPGLQVEVESVEYQGADSVIACRLGGQAIAARVPGRWTARAGEPLRLGWSDDAPCWFDAATGRRIASPHRSQSPELSPQPPEEQPCNVAIS